MHSNTNPVTMAPWSPEPELIDSAILHAAAPGTLLLLPQKMDDRGQALYRDDNAGLVKTVRAEGASIDFAWPSERRVYLSEYSAGEVIANIALSMIGNFTTDTIKYIIYVIRLRLATALGGPLPDDLQDVGSIKVKIARFDDSRDRRVIEGFECTGPVDGVVEVIESLTDTSIRAHLKGESDAQDS